MNHPDNFVPGAPMVFLGPNDWCMAHIAAAVLGYTPKAIERKREQGVWVEGVHWRKAPDGHVFVSLSAVSKWIASRPANSRPKRKATHAWPSAELLRVPQK
jgi:hypothetical protein